LLIHGEIVIQAMRLTFVIGSTAALRARFSFEIDNSHIGNVRCGNLLAIRPHWFSFDCCLEWQTSVLHPTSLREWGTGLRKSEHRHRRAQNQTAVMARWKWFSVTLAVSSPRA
jgi:hypothetical protein